MIESIKKEIKESILTKWIGCFVASVAAVLSIIQAITYSGVAAADFNVNAVVFSLLGAALFVLLSLSRKTSSLAPVALMICDFVALLSFVGVIIDYFSTLFFDGFSMDKLFSQEAAYSFSTVSFVLSTIIASVAVYLPQNRKIDREDDIK